MNWKRARSAQAVAVAVLAAIGLSARESAATKTFFIDESTDFTGNGCENIDVNDITTYLQTKLVTNGGFTGNRFANPGAWPQDFTEQCSTVFGTDGIDNVEADARVLSVYAGHGNIGVMQWGTIHNGRCTTKFGSNMHLGSMAGATSGLAMYLTSCTLKTDNLGNSANTQWLRQQMGFHNSPDIGDGDPGSFAYCTSTSTATNVSCYLGALEDKPGVFTGDNSPVVVGQGTDSNDCQYTQSHARLFGDVLNSNRPGGPSCNQGQPAFWYCYNWIDHGTSATCVFTP